MPSMRWMYRLASTLTLAGGASLLGCAATSTPVPANATSSFAAGDDDSAADLADHARHHQQGGVTMFVALSLDALGLPPDQQATVRRIQEELFTKIEPSRVAAQGVLTALADGLAAGAIDKGKVDAAIGQLEATSGQVHEATADAMNQLHAALTPPQRSALVDKLLAHWSVFKQANAVDDPAGKDNKTGRLAELATELGLSPEQVEKIRGNFHNSTAGLPGGADPADVDAHLQRLAAFRDDVFDARTLSGGPAANAHLASWASVRMARFYEAVDPVLTPDQRGKLTQILREHASHKDTALATQ